MRAEWRSLAEPREFCVLGVRLRPFSLAHAYVLLAMDSPFAQTATPAMPPSLADLSAAVAVCGMECWPLDRVGSQLARRFTPRRARRWGKRVGMTASPEAFAAFGDYLDHFSQSPPRHIPAKQRRQCPIPWPVAIATGLQRDGYEPREAWTMPLNKAFALRTTGQYLDGDDTYLPEADANLLEEARRGASNPTK